MTLNIILTNSQQRIELTHFCSLFSREEGHTSLIVFRATQPDIYHTPGEHVNHYAIKEVILQGVYNLLESLNNNRTFFFARIQDNRH